MRNSPFFSALSATTRRNAVFAFAILMALVYSPQRGWADDEMDALATGPVPTTVQSAQAELILPDGEFEVGVPFALRVRILVDGDFEGIDLKFDSRGQAFLIPTPFRSVGPGEFVAEYRVRRAGEHSFTPELRAKVAGQEEPIRLNVAPLLIRVAAPSIPQSTVIREVTPPRELPFDYTWRNVIVGTGSLFALILIVAAAVLAYRWWKRRALIVPPVIVRPAIETALEDVMTLSTLEIFTTQGSDAHYTALSMALRRYLEKEFGAPAVEMTEDEVIEFVRQNLSTTQQSDMLRHVFTRSSLAKFARQAITRELAAEDCKASLDFLLRERDRITAREQALRAREAAQERPAA